jgi:hypothetical protein
MTLIIASKRESFAVLASDGLWMPSGEDAPKIVCHSPPLAIACTVSGLVALPLPAHDPFRTKHSIPPDCSARATTYIGEVLDEITSIDDLTTEDIGQRLTVRLAAFVNGDDYLACHVAMVKDDKADVGFMLIGTGAMDAPVNHGAWGWWPNGIELYTPESLRDLLETRLTLAATAPVNTVDDLVAIMRTIVNEAIAEDRKRTGGNGSIGGTAHVAKVTRDGAFLI